MTLGTSAVDVISTDRHTKRSCCTFTLLSKVQIFCRQSKAVEPAKYGRRQERVFPRQEPLPQRQQSVSSSESAAMRVIARLG